MKVLLLKDVYHLGRAGDVKKVANGYGRNFLIPQGFAVLATPKALEKAESIREVAAVERAVQNKEMEGIAKQLEDSTLYFASKAVETGKLNGSITAHMVAEAINEKIGGEALSHRHIHIQPIRNLGEHTVEVRLTLDLTPTVDVLVYREGETPAALRPDDEVVEEVVLAAPIDAITDDYDDDEDEYYN